MFQSEGYDDGALVKKSLWHWGLFHGAGKVPTPLLLWKTHALKLVMVGLVKTELQMETSLWHTYTLTEIWAMIMVDYDDVWFMIDDIIIMYYLHKDFGNIFTGYYSECIQNTHSHTYTETIRIWAVT